MIISENVLNIILGFVTKLVTTCGQLVHVIECKALILHHLNCCANRNIFIIITNPLFLSHEQMNPYYSRMVPPWT